MTGMAHTRSCFLAQDKVADFAKMSTEFTLSETMRAAGDTRLPQWHEQLKLKGKICKELAEVSEPLAPSAC
jgi:hypothetical protein